MNYSLSGPYFNTFGRRFMLSITPVFRYNEAGDFTVNDVKE